MPTFEMNCAECGHQFEVFDSYRNLEMYRCEACSSGNIRISPSAPNVHFKASPGETRRVEVVYNNEDGTKKVERLKHLEGKSYNPENKKFQGARQ